jgi:hypothetical protein
MSTGPFPDDIPRDLEALKHRLAAMTSADELRPDQLAAMRTEISAIRLHLKRLAEERKWVEGVGPRAVDD